MYGVVASWNDGGGSTGVFSLVCLNASLNLPMMLVMDDKRQRERLMYGGPGSRAAVPFSKTSTLP